MKEQLTPEEVLAMMTTSMVVPIHDGNMMDLALKEFLEFHRIAYGQNTVDGSLRWNMVVASHKIHNIALELLDLHFRDMTEDIAAIESRSRNRLETVLNPQLDSVVPN